MQSIPVTFYDGLFAKPHQAEMSPIDHDSIMIQFYDPELRKYSFRIDQMTLIGALGKRNPVLELDNDARIEFLNAELPDWLHLKSKSINRKVWMLEKSPSLIIFSVIFVIVLAFSVVKWGIPLTAKIVAFQLPANTLVKIGDSAENYVLEKWTMPTHLPQGQREQIQTQYLEKIADGHPAKLVFREGARLGANAVALPNNTIIITDELIELAHSDQEILGVLAHEQGHLIERHSLQQGLSSLGFSLLYVAVTGDSSDLVTTLPLAIVGAGYSRNFEKEADLYALKLMDRKGIEVSHFANFLQRLNDHTEEGEKKNNDTQPTTANSKNKQNTEHKVDSKGSETQTEVDEKSKLSGLWDALSSHPATEERIQMVRDFEKQQKKTQ